MACPRGSWEEWAFGLCSIIFIQGRGRYGRSESVLGYFSEKDWRTREFSGKISGLNVGDSFCAICQENLDLYKDLAKSLQEGFFFIKVAFESDSKPVEYFDEHLIILRGVLIVDMFVALKLLFFNIYKLDFIYL